MNEQGIERNFVRWIVFLRLMNAQSTVLINWRHAFMSAAGVAPSYVFERRSNPVSVGPAGPRNQAQWMPHELKTAFSVFAA
jgi:hypothetical protein